MKERAPCVPSHERYIAEWAGLPLGQQAKFDLFVEVLVTPRACNLLCEGLVTFCEEPQLKGP